MFKKFLVKERKILIASIVSGLIITICSAFFAGGYSNLIQTGIADDVIRLHVLANSNSTEDQELKTKVRDGILEQFENELKHTSDINGTREFILKNINVIEECATRVINKNGYKYTVSASLASDFFPTKLYGDIVLPAGNYEALRIEIGEASGNNWWCVVFPPLCYVDAALNEIPEENKEELKNILTDEEYEIISSERSAQVTPKIKFKIVEIWQKIRNSF